MSTNHSSGKKTSDGNSWYLSKVYWPPDVRRSSPGATDPLNRSGVGGDVIGPCCCCIMSCWKLMRADISLTAIMMRRRAPSGLMPRFIKSCSLSVGKTVMSISPSMKHWTWCWSPMLINNVSMSLYFDNWLRWRDGVESISDVVLKNPPIPTSAGLESIQALPVWWGSNGVGDVREIPAPCPKIIRDFIILTIL